MIYSLCFIMKERKLPKLSNQFNNTTNSSDFSSANLETNLALTMTGTSGNLPLPKTLP